MADIRGYLKEHTNPPVFIASALLTLAFVAWGVAAPGQLGKVANGVIAWITTYFGWWYILSVTGFLVFILYLLISPYGGLRVGKDDETPEWGTWSWFSMLFTAGASIVWFSIFGGSAILEVMAGGNEALANAGTTDALFILINQLSLPGWLIPALSLLAILVVAIFFATSSDSGSLVVDMLTNGGDPHPIWQQRLFWAVLEGVIAAVLLVAGAAVGGDPLSALQTASVTSGLPFSVVLAFVCWGLMRQLRREQIPLPPVRTGRAAGRREREKRA